VDSLESRTIKQIFRSSTSIDSILQNDASCVVRGTVIRDLSSAPRQSHHGMNEDESLPDTRKYIVQVSRVIKGCAVRAMDRIMVASFVSPEICGQGPLALNTEYIFSSTAHSQPMDIYSRAELGNRSKVKQTMWTTSCGFNLAWDAVSTSEREVIRGYRNQCPTTA
jgi:hypothetical protein